MRLPRYWFAAALGAGIFTICAWGLYVSSHLIPLTSLWR